MANQANRVLVHKILKETVLLIIVDQVEISVEIALEHILLDLEQ